MWVTRDTWVELGALVSCTVNDSYTSVGRAVEEAHPVRLTPRVSVRAYSCICGQAPI